MSASTSERTNDANGAVTVNTRVCVYPGTAEEGRGVVIEDFGDMVGYAGERGDQHQSADPAHRWAVMLEAGNLVFVDSEDLVAE